MIVREALVSKYAQMSVVGGDLQWIVCMSKVQYQKCDYWFKDTYNTYNLCNIHFNLVTMVKSAILLIIANSINWIYLT